MKKITTHIVIQEKPEQVWSVLTDFEKYNEWNPFITSLKGPVKVGNTIEVQLPKMSFKPTVLTYTTNQELRWVGRLFFKGIFDGEHSFTLKDNGDNSTTFIHQEQFSGILVPFLGKMLEETKQGFEDFNVSLKKRVES